ncbi:uncharacterized protein J3D65DRAFT_606839 [Phyllosticta citribraziliensis]|uniref:Uncharacterized protein n=1 Tax=Phyllosticta citribraziliensis TaxID=989973 RepID=A0ABR1L954_9PEZI
MSIHVQFESPDPRLPNNQLKDECETAGKGHEINVPHRSIISQTMAERILHHHKNLRRNSKVWNEFLSLKPDIVRRPDFSRGDLPLDTSHYSGYSLGLVAQCSSVAVEAAKPCRCCESSGTFKSCRQIIWPGRGYLWGGCCVGCRFNRSAKLCSFHANYVDKGPSRRRSKGTPRTQPRGRPRRQAQMPQSRSSWNLECIEEVANSSNDTPTPRDGLAGIMAGINEKFDHIRNVQNTQLATMKKQYKSLQRQNEELARKVDEFSAEIQRQVSRIEASQEEAEDSGDNEQADGSGRRLRSRFFMGGKRLPGQ